MQKLFNLNDDPRTLGTLAEYRDAVREASRVKTEDELTGITGYRSSTRVKADAMAEYMRAKLTYQVALICDERDELRELVDSGKFAGTSVDLTTGEVTAETLVDAAISVISKKIERGSDDCDCPACTARRMLEAGKSKREVAEYLKVELERELAKPDDLKDPEYVAGFLDFLKGEGINVDLNVDDFRATGKEPGFVTPERLNELRKGVVEVGSPEENRKEGERIAEEEALDEVQRELDYENR